MKTNSIQFPKIMMNEFILKKDILSPIKQPKNKKSNFINNQKPIQKKSLKKKMMIAQIFLNKFRTERFQTLQNNSKKNNNICKKQSTLNKTNKKNDKQNKNNGKIMVEDFKFSLPILIHTNLQLQNFLKNLEPITKFKSNIEVLKKIGKGYSSEVYLGSLKLSLNKFILKAFTIEFLNKKNHLEMIKVSIFN